MNQRMRGAGIRAINTKSSVMGVVMLACVPVFCSLVMAPQAGALSPLRPVRDIVSPVIGVLSDKQSPQSDSTEPVHQATAPLRAAGVSLPIVVSDKATPSAHRPNVAPPSRLQTNPNSAGNSGVSSNRAFTPLTLVDATLPQPSQSPRTASLVATVPNTATSRAAFAGWLQSTPQGWQLVGVLWYWWLLMISVAYMTSRYAQGLFWLLTARYGKVTSK